MLEPDAASLSTTAVVILAATAFIAGMARGFSGFGAALIFIPLSSAMIGPKAAAPLLLIIDGVLAAGLIPDAWRRADKREVWTMALGALIGVPMGTWLLASMDPRILRWGIVVLAAAMLFLLVSGWRYRGKPTKSATVGVGVLSGLFNGAAQVGGPPIVAYWLGGAIPAATVRANMILFFATSTLITTVTYYLGGLLTRSAFSLVLFVGPAYGLGILIGSRLFGLATESTFRLICCGLIAVAVLLGLPVLDSVIR
jgi:uncharacterized membrane protein YfcA